MVDDPLFNHLIEGLHIVPEVFSYEPWRVRLGHR